MLLDLLHRQFPEPRRAGQVTLKPAFLHKRNKYQRSPPKIRRRVGNNIIKKMKRNLVLLVISMVTAFPLFAQIGFIKSYDDPMEKLSISEYMSMYRERATNVFTLKVHSDNEYEDKDVVLNLGTGAKATLHSIINLIQAIETSDEQKFDIQGYTFSVHGEDAYVGGYQLAYTAGNYIVNIFDLKQCVLCCYCFTKNYEDCILSLDERYTDRKGRLKLTLELSIPKYDIRCGYESLYIISTNQSDSSVFEELNKWNIDSPLSIEQKNTLKMYFEQNKLDRTYNFYAFRDESQFVRKLAAMLIGVSEKFF